MIPFRKQLRMATASAEVVGKFRFIWKHTRKYQVWVLRTYARVANIADKNGVIKPRPLIKMREE